MEFPKPKMIGATLFLTSFLAPMSSSLAQESAAERAGELKSWREQCADPDVDLRIAFLEVAIESDDRVIQRICIRQALQSTDSDIVNLGLRAAISVQERITFEVALPESIEKAIKEAEGNQDELSRIYRSGIHNVFERIRPSITFEVEDASLMSATSTWYALVNRNSVDDKLKGPATITGHSVNWVGRTELNTRCTLDASLNSGTKLTGTLQCNDYAPYLITAPLL